MIERKEIEVRQREERDRERERGGKREGGDYSLHFNEGDMTHCPEALTQG